MYVSYQIEYSFLAILSGSYKNYILQKKISC